MIINKKYKKLKPKLNSKKKIQNISILVLRLFQKASKHYYVMNLGNIEIFFILFIFFCSISNKIYFENFLCNFKFANSLNYFNLLCILGREGFSGNYYIGEWKNDKKEGQGDYHWADGDVYKGQWKNSKREGQGTQTFASGKVKTGQWKDDKFVG